MMTLNERGDAFGAFFISRVLLLLDRPAAYLYGRRITYLKEGDKQEKTQNKSSSRGSAVFLKGYNLSKEFFCEKKDVVWQPNGSSNITFFYKNT